MVSDSEQQAGSDTAEHDDSCKLDGGEMMNGTDSREGEAGLRVGIRNALNAEESTVVMLAGKEEQVEVLTEQIRVMNTRLIEARRETLNQEIAAHEATTSASKAESHLRRVELESQLKAEQCSRLEAERNRCAESVEALQKELKEERRAATENQLSGRAEISALQERLGAAEVAQKNLSARWEKFQEEQFTRQEELVERAVCAEMTSERKERAFELAEANWKDASSQLEAANATIDKVTEQNDNLSRQLEENKNELVGLRQRCQELEQERAIQHEESEALRRAAEDAATASAAATAAGRGRRWSSDGAEGVNGLASEGSEVLQELMSRLEGISGGSNSQSGFQFKMLEDLGRQLKENRFLTSKANSLESNMQVAQVENNRLAAAVNSLTAENSELRECVAATLRQVSSLQQAVDERDARLMRVQLQARQGAEQVELLEQHIKDQDSLLARAAHDRAQLVRQLRQQQQHSAGSSNAGDSTFAEDFPRGGRRGRRRGGKGDEREDSGDDENEDDDDGGEGSDGAGDDEEGEAENVGGVNDDDDGMSSTTSEPRSFREFLDLAQENTDLRLKLNRMQKHASSASDSLMRNLKEQVDKAREEVEISARNYGELEESMRQKISLMTDDRNNLSVKIAELSLEKERLVGKLSALTRGGVNEMGGTDGVLSPASAESSSRQRDSEALKKSLQQTASLLESANAEVKTLRFQLADTRGNLTVKDLELSAARTNLQREEERYHKMVESHRGLMTELGELQRTLAIKEGELESQKEQTRLQERIAAQKTREFEEQRATNLSAQTYCVQIEAQASAASADFARQSTMWKEENCRLQAALDRLTAEIAGLRKRYERDLEVFSARLVEERAHQQDAERMARNSEFSLKLKAQELDVVKASLARMEAQAPQDDAKMTAASAAEPSTAPVGSDADARVAEVTDLAAEASAPSRTPSQAPLASVESPNSAVAPPALASVRPSLAVDALLLSTQRAMLLGSTGGADHGGTEAVGSMVTENAALRSDNEALKVKINFLDTEIEGLRGSESRNLDLVEKWQKMASDLREECEALKVRVEEAQRSAELSRQRLATTEVEIMEQREAEMRAVDAAAAAKAMSETLKATNEEIDLQLNILKVQRDEEQQRFQVQFTQKERELAMSKDENEEIRGAYNKAVQLHTNEVQRVAAAREDAAKARESLVKEEAAHRELQSKSAVEIATVRADMEHLRKAASASADQVTRLSDENQSLSKLLKERLDAPDSGGDSPLKSRVSEVNSMRQMLEMQLAEANFDLQKAVYEKTSLGIKAEALQRQLDASMQKVEEVTNQLMLAQSSVDVGKIAEFENLKSRLQSIQAEKLALVESRREAESHAEKERKENEPLRAAIREKTGAVENLKIRLSEFTASSEKWQSQYMTLLKTFEGVDAVRHRQLEVEVKELQEKTNASESKCAELTNRITESEKTCDELKGGKEEAEKKLATLTTQLNECRVQLSQAKQQLSAAQLAQSQAQSQLAAAKASAEQGADLERQKSIVKNYARQLEELKARCAELQRAAAQATAAGPPPTTIPPRLVASVLTLAKLASLSQATAAEAVSSAERSELRVAELEERTFSSCRRMASALTTATSSVPLATSAAANAASTAVTVDGGSDEIEKSDEMGELEEGEEGETINDEMDGGSAAAPGASVGEEQGELPTTSGMATGEAGDGLAESGEPESLGEEQSADQQMAEDGTAEQQMVATADGESVAVELKAAEGMEDGTSAAIIIGSDEEGAHPDQDMQDPVGA